MRPSERGIVQHVVREGRAKSGASLNFALGVAKNRANRCPSAAIPTCGKLRTCCSNL